MSSCKCLFFDPGLSPQYTLPLSLFFMIFLPSLFSPASKSSCERRHQALEAFFLQNHYSGPGQGSKLWKPKHPYTERTPQPPETPTHPYITVHLSTSKERLQKPPRPYSRLPHHHPTAQPFTLAQTGRSGSSNQPGVSVLAPVLLGSCQPHQNPWEWFPHLSKWPEWPSFNLSDSAGPWRSNQGSRPSSSWVSKTCSVL